MRLPHGKSNFSRTNRMTAEDLTNLNAASQASWKEAMKFVRRILPSNRRKWFERLRTATPESLRKAKDAELETIRRLACLAAGEAILRCEQEYAERYRHEG